MVAPNYAAARSLVAKALRDDCERVDELLRKRPTGSAPEQEESKLRARITETAKAIGCPVGYGAVQARKDSNRLHQLYCKRISPPQCGGGPLPDAEDAEEAQLRARVEAFNESPEGLARRRMREMPFHCSPAEQSELDGLRALYPDPPLDPDDPLQAMWIGRL